MNVFALKLIGLITMIIDHYGAIFRSGDLVFRMIGRIAFPIYAFLLVEGYFHTRDVKKYGIRLLLFALISEFPFDFAFYNGISFIHQNIFFTLFLGLVTMYFLDNKNKYNINSGMVLGFSIFIASITFVDYNFIGIIYILSFYYTRSLPKLRKFSLILLILFISNLFTGSILQQFSILALPLIYLYNGNLGPKNKIFQWFFYVAYPLHLFIFYMVSYIN